MLFVFAPPADGYNGGLRAFSFPVREEIIWVVHALGGHFGTVRKYPA